MWGQFFLPFLKRSPVSGAEFVEFEWCVPKTGLQVNRLTRYQVFSVMVPSKAPINTVDSIRLRLTLVTWLIHTCS